MLNLRRYDVQARLSVYLSSASLVCMAGTAVVVFQHFVWREKVILFNPASLRVPLIYGLGAAALGLGALGFGLGLNSAGQRRNDKPAHSWIGFFLGAASISLSLILVYVFRSWGLAV